MYPRDSSKFKQVSVQHRRQWPTKNTTTVQKHPLVTILDSSDATTVKDHPLILTVRMLDSNKLNNARVGDRIECQGHFGTIKYIGEVDGYAGYWLGVDWDNPDRGKHNGIVKGKAYFTARSETSGSFVRPEKVQLGQSLITSITSRYGEREDEITAKFTQQQMLSLQQTMKAPLLEFVGFDKITDKQSNYNDLDVINVRLHNVSSVGEPGELKHLCPNVKELDLSKNLLNSWSTVVHVLNELESLRCLVVSENIVNIPPVVTENTFPNLKMFICGSMRLSWDDLKTICAAFPNLESLIAPNNEINNLDVSRGQFANLKMLDLENNPLDGWTDVCKLGHLQNLEVLNLESTGIVEIRFEEEEETELFKGLHTLILKNNLIFDWESIGELNKLASFNNFKFLNNPVCDKESAANCMQLIIARIGKLQTFNGTELTDERKGAEYDYIKKHGLEWLSVKDDKEKRAKFLRKHNRYLELINKYGESEESELKVEVKTIQVSLVEMKLVYEDRIIVKKLPPSILIQKLIMLVQRLFNLSDRPTLIYISNEEPDIEIDLDDECKELGVYSVQNGDRIVVKT